MESDRAYHTDHTRITTWFQRLQEAISEYGIKDQDIYNIDKTGFLSGTARRSKVIVYTKLKSH